MFRFILQVAILLVWSAGALAQGHEDSKVFTGVVNDDIFTGARSVDIDGDVMGDVFAAGGMISLAGTVADQAVVAGGQLKLKSAVKGDVLAAGGSVDVGGSVGHNLVVAGGNITVSGPVAGKVMAAGGHVEIARDTPVGGSACLSGGMVVMKGNIKRDLTIYAGQAVIYGEVEGNVTVEADSLSVEPGARIAGTLTFKGPSAPSISKDAVVLGAVNHVQRPGFAAMAQKARGWAIALAFMPFLMLLVTGVFLILTLPCLSRRISWELRERLLASLGLGVLLVFGLPAVIGILFITVIGIPIALAALAIYLVVLMAGVPMAGMGLARFVLNRAGKTPRGWAAPGGYLLLLSLTYVGFLLLIFLVGWLPMIGGFIWTIALCTGYGAGVLAIVRLIRSSRIVPEAAAPPQA